MNLVNPAGWAAMLISLNAARTDDNPEPEQVTESLAYFFAHSIWMQMGGDLAPRIHRVLSASGSPSDVLFARQLAHRFGLTNLCVELKDLTPLDGVRSVIVANAFLGEGDTFRIIVDQLRELKRKTPIKVVAAATILSHQKGGEALIKGLGITLYLATHESALEEARQLDALPRVGDEAPAAPTK